MIRKFFIWLLKPLEGHFPYTERGKKYIDSHKL